MDCSPLGSLVYRILQARILGCIAISFSRGSSRTRDQTWASCTAGGFFTTEPAGKSKKAEHWRIDAFELWCWRRLLRGPGTARRSNPSIPKEISPEYSLEEGWCWSSSSNILVTWCEEPTHWEKTWCWERLRTRGQWGNGGWDCWMASPILWTWVWTNPRRQWRTGKPSVLQSMGSQRVRYDVATDQQ